MYQPMTPNPLSWYDCLIIVSILGLALWFSYLSMADADASADQIVLAVEALADKGPFHYGRTLTPAEEAILASGGTL